MTVGCVRFLAGNNSFNALLTVCLESVEQVPGTTTIEAVYSVELTPRDGGGFYAQPTVETTLDGRVISTQTHDTGFARREFTVRESGVSNGDHTVCVTVTNREEIEYLP